MRETDKRSATAAGISGGLSTKGWVLHILAIAGLCILAYSNTFEVPFQWDGDVYIRENPLVKDLGYFLEPSTARGYAHYDALTRRYVCYLSFAVNYALGGLDVTGYHMVNMAIHIANSLLVYALVLLTFRTPFLSGLAFPGRRAALLSALFFALHPLQTEAVTYIFQRLASLVAFFCLLSLVCYARARLAEGRAASYSYLMFSVLAAAVAMKTKENAFILPVLALLYEFLFFRGPAARRLLGLAPLLLTMLIVPLSLAGVEKPMGEMLGDVAPALRGYGEISRSEYLFTQFRVIVTYLRFIFLPVGQSLQHDYPVYGSFIEPPVALSFVLLSCIAALGLFLIHRSRRGSPQLRVAGFGIIWFFVALSVESSIVPIPMVIDEYRVYLPSVGLFMALATGALSLSSVFGNKAAARAAALLVVLVLAVLAYATFERNGVWQSRVSLWEDVVRKSPSLAYARNNLGVIYMEEGMLDEAERELRAAIRLKPDHERAYNNLGMVFVQRGRPAEAEEAFKAALALRPDNAKAHNNLGVIYVRQGRLKEAELEFRTAVALKPGEADSHNNLGGIYLAQDRLAEAEQEFRRAIELRPDLARAHYNLGLLYERLGRRTDALLEFRKTLELDPGHEKARLKLIGSPQGP